MRVLAINSGNFGSTGNIMINIIKSAKCEYMFAVAASNSNRKKKIENCIEIGNRFERNASLLYANFTGISGTGSILGTRQFLKKVEKFSPDIIHLHNLHNCYINLPMLFSYIKKKNIPVVWTLHDCWAFTGRCPHFSGVNCNRWKKGCHDCPLPIKNYPESYLDRTKIMWKKKKEWFTGVKNMTVVTPSQWLADLVKESFLNQYNIRVINNGIDLSVFKPCISEFRKKFHLEHKYIILGVANPWSKQKGLDVFLHLSKMLNDHYRIILVGANQQSDCVFPNNIISICHTDNKKELSQIYSCADVFVNPTREENYPTVNMEALACGTPVITFRTGGSPETINEKCGIVVSIDDMNTLKKKIQFICEDNYLNYDDCIAQSKKFDMGICFQKYIKLYNEML